MPTENAKRARRLMGTKLKEDLRQTRALQDGEVSSAEAFVSGLAEGAFLIAAADGQLDAREAETLADTLAYVMGERLDPEEFAGMIDAFAEALADDGVEERLAALAAAVPKKTDRREILAFSCALALADEELAGTEVESLARMASAFGLPHSLVDQFMEAR